MTGRHKGLLIILDGVGDRPADALGGQTPLEAARTPHLDDLAARALCGMVDPLFPGTPVGTQTGCAALMGLAPRSAGTLARGPVEAAGLGLDLGPGDVALHANFAALRRDGDGLTIVDRRAGRIREGTAELAAALEGLDLGDQIVASVHPATGHRAVVRLSGLGLSGAVSDTDPGAGAAVTRVLSCHPLAARAECTAEAVNRLILEAHQRLDAHPVNARRRADGLVPANGLITRGAGTAARIRSRLNHLGVRAAAVAGERTVLGVARLFGYTAITDPRFTSLPDTDLGAKVEAARHALESHDLVFLHVKGPDICAHDLDPVGKKEFLERADAMLAPALAADLVIGVSGDHSTDSNTGRHCGDPVPSLLAAPRGRRDACRGYAEGDCMRGGLGRITAPGFLGSLLDAMGVVPNYRAPDGDFFAPC